MPTLVIEICVLWMHPYKIKKSQKLLVKKILLPGFSRRVKDQVPQG